MNQRWILGVAGALGAVLAVAGGWIYARSTDAPETTEHFTQALPVAVRVNGEPLDERSLDRAIEFAEQRSGFRLTLPAAFSELGLVLLRVDVRETREGRQVELLFDNWPPDPRAQMTTAILVTTPGGLLPEDWAVLDLGLEDVQARWIDDQPSPGSAPQIRIWSARANQQVSLIVLGPNRPALDGAAAMLRSWLEANP